MGDNNNWAMNIPNPAAFPGAAAAGGNSPSTVSVPGGCCEWVDEINAVTQGNSQLMAEHHADQLAILDKQHEHEERLQSNKFNLGYLAEIGATLLLLEWQRDQYDDIEATRIAHIRQAQRCLCRRFRDIRRNLENVIDDVPQPAMYQPVSPSGLQLEVASDNVIMTHEVGSEYARLIGKYHFEHDMARAVCMNPKYYQMSEITWVSIGDLLEGKLPVGDVMEVMTDSAEQAILTGRMGHSCAMTMRNLGVSKLRAQQLGRSEQRLERASIENHISPLSRQGDIRTMQMGPAESMGWALQQAQLLQNSLQNANNACAKKAPYLWHQMQMDVNHAINELQLNAGKANLVNQFVPNYASIFARQINDLAGGLANFNSSSVSTGQSYEQPYAWAQPVASSGMVSSGKNPIN